jgi:hypothetical protein
MPCRVKQIGIIIKGKRMLGRKMMEMVHKMMKIRRLHKTKILMIMTQLKKKKRTSKLKLKKTLHKQKK